MADFRYKHETFVGSFQIARLVFSLIVIFFEGGIIPLNPLFLEGIMQSAD
jgi:hypothetical protein